MKRLKPKLSSTFNHICDPAQLEHLEAGIQRVLTHIYPPSFFEMEGAPRQFVEQLPVVCWTSLKKVPFALSFFMVTEFRQNAFRFFYDMISRWLIPGTRLNILHQFAVDFSLPEITERPLIAGEIMLEITSLRSLELLQKNLPIIEAELRSGMQSEYQASRILEIKGLSHDDKTSLVQSNILALIQQRPQDFDYAILSEMQQFMIASRDEFKERRSYRHLSKIICVHYLFRKSLYVMLEAYPDKREVNVKLIRSYVEGKKVLGIAIGLSFLKSHELFEAKHMMNAVRTLVPDLHLVEGSFFSMQNRSGRLLTFYIEVEREGAEVSMEEQHLLKHELALELKNSIEVRLSPIFMPQNEEELMRHVVALSGQLRYVRDLPQVVIHFTGQSEYELEFIVVALRLLKGGEVGVKDLFETQAKSVKCLFERQKIVGSLRKKYPKEANIFRLKIAKDPFLRQDHSVDLYKARRRISNELTKVIGEFRDYNGGMIAKETEGFYKLNALVGDQADEEAFFLENFFYALSPPEMRSVLAPSDLKHLFQILLELEEEGVDEEQKFVMRLSQNDDRLIIGLIGIDTSFQQELSLGLEPHLDHTLPLATTFVTSEQYPCFGLLYQNPEKGVCDSLKRAVEEAMQRWSDKKNFVLTS
jgi:hypothetical protein